MDRQPLSLSDLNGYGPPRGGQTGADGVRCSTPDPTRYHDPSSQHFEQGGSLLGVAGMRNGLRGTVIPRATHGGVSRGCDPNKPRIVLIDPGEDGRGTTLDLATLTPTAVKAATVAVRRAFDDAIAADTGEVSQDPDQQRREEISTRVRVLARQAEIREEEPRPQAAPAQPVHAMPEPTGLSRVFSGGMLAHATPAAVLGGQEPRTVVFGIGGEDIPGRFTTVQRLAGATPTTGALVLGGAPGAFFPKGKQPFAAHVRGEPKVLRLESTGIRFEHAGEELAIYLITAETTA